MGGVGAKVGGVVEGTNEGGVLDVKVGGVLEGMTLGGALGGVLELGGVLGGRVGMESFALGTGFGGGPPAGPGGGPLTAGPGGGPAGEEFNFVRLAASIDLKSFGCFSGGF